MQTPSRLRAMVGRRAAASDERHLLATGSSSEECVCIIETKGPPGWADFSTAAMPRHGTHGARVMAPAELPTECSHV